MSLLMVDFLFNHDGVFEKRCKEALSYKKKFDASRSQKQHRDIQKSCKKTKSTSYNFSACDFVYLINQNMNLIDNENQNNH